LDGVADGIFCAWTEMAAQTSRGYQDPYLWTAAYGQLAEEDRDEFGIREA
jgi:hypothetical protein